MFDSTRRWQHTEAIALHLRGTERSRRAVLNTGLLPAPRTWPRARAAVQECEAPWLAGPTSVSSDATPINGDTLRKAQWVAERVSSNNVVVVPPSGRCDPLPRRAGRALGGGAEARDVASQAQRRSVDLPEGVHAAGTGSLASDPVQVVHELCRAHTQSPRESYDVDHGYIALAALDPADVRAVEARQGG
jgi:hypothetical protein